MRRGRPTTHDAVVEAVRRSLPDPDVPIDGFPGESDRNVRRASVVSAATYASCEYLANEAKRQAEILADADAAVSVVVEDDDSLVVHVGNAIQAIKEHKA